MVEDLVARLRRTLPASWVLSSRQLPVAAGTAMPDFLFTMKTPNGDATTFAVEAKKSTPSPESVVRELKELAGRNNQQVLLVAPYLGKSARERLADAGISYADSTGWVRIVNDSPMIYVEGVGADKAPRDRTKSNITDLSGASASRIIRVLLNAAPPLGVRELAAKAATSPGTVSKVLPTLTTEGVIDRDTKGVVTSIRKRALLDRWTQDYRFQDSNDVSYFLAPRGIDKTLDRLQELDGVWLTGSTALRTQLPAGVVPVVPLTRVAAYVRDPRMVADELGATETEPSTANLMLAVSKDPNTPGAGGTTPAFAPLPLALADAATMPGRLSAMADQALDYLAGSDESWGE